MKMEKVNLADRVQAFGIALTSRQEEQFTLYYEILKEWNRFMNLTAITSFGDVMDKHFSDSLSLCLVCNPGEADRLLDVGTGAGFPGIPLKIVFPGIRVTLLDSLNKRIKFLNEVINRLGLTGIEAVHGRAEEAGRLKPYRETYDLCVSRAVANLSTLSEYCIPFVRKGGCFVSYKSGSAQKELEQAKKAVRILGAECEEVRKFTLPGTDLERMLIVMRKIKSTPSVYPRGGGRPQKEPLA